MVASDVAIFWAYMFLGHLTVLLLTLVSLASYDKGVWPSCVYVLSSSELRCTDRQLCNCVMITEVQEVICLRIRR